MHVLVVEDDVDQWIALQRFIKSKGGYAFWASRGLQAIHWLLSERIDVVLLDVDVAGGELTGLDVLRSMLEKQNLRRIPVIVLTDVDIATIQEQAKTPATSLFDTIRPVILEKPVNLRRLGHLLDTLTGGTGAP